MANTILLGYIKNGSRPHIFRAIFLAENANMKRLVLNGNKHVN